MKQIDIYDADGVWQSGFKFEVPSSICIAWSAADIRIICHRGAFAILTDMLRNILRYEDVLDISQTDGLEDEIIDGKRYKKQNDKG